MSELRYAKSSVTGEGTMCSIESDAKSSVTGEGIIYSIESDTPLETKGWYT